MDKNTEKLLEEVGLGRNNEEIVIVAGSQIAALNTALGFYKIDKKIPSFFEISIKETIKTLESRIEKVNKKEKNG